MVRMAHSRGRQHGRPHTGLTTIAAAPRRVSSPDEAAWQHLLTRLRGHDSPLPPAKAGVHRPQPPTIGPS